MQRVATESRRILHHAGGALPLQDPVDDHLGQGARRAKLVEHGRGARSEQLDIALEAWREEGQHRVRDRELLRIERREQLLHRRALTRRADDGGGLLPIALEGIRVLEPAERLGDAVDGEAVEEIEERETVLQDRQRLTVTNVAEPES